MENLEMKKTVVHIPTGIEFSCMELDGRFDEKKKQMVYEKVAITRGNRTNIIPYNIFSKFYESTEDNGKRKDNEKILMEKQIKRRIENELKEEKLREIERNKSPEQKAKERYENRREIDEDSYNEKVCEYVLTGLENTNKYGCYNPVRPRVLECD